jgi:hypothetical protein
MSTTSDTGIDGFIAGLRRCGQEPTIEAGVVTFTVEPLSGAHACKSVATGVGTEELSGWPAIPPHWVHLPANITFARSNTQASPIAGWLKHSRQIAAWGNAAEPAQAWISHVRAVLGEAT